MLKVSKRCINAYNHRRQLPIKKKCDEKTLIGRLVILLHISNIASNSVIDAASDRIDKNKETLSDRKSLEDEL